MTLIGKEYSTLALTIIGQAVFIFATPIGTNQLLMYAHDLFGDVISTNIP